MHQMAMLRLFTRYCLPHFKNEPTVVHIVLKLRMLVHKLVYCSKATAVLLLSLFLSVLASLIHY